MYLKRVVEDDYTILKLYNEVYSCCTINSSVAKHDEFRSITGYEVGVSNS